MSGAIRARGNPEANQWQLAGAAGEADRDDATGTTAGVPFRSMQTVSCQHRIASATSYLIIPTSTTTRNQFLAL